MRNIEGYRVMQKSKCKFCEAVSVYNEDGTKKLGNYKCAIDCEDFSYGCQAGLCNYYKRGGGE